MLLEKIDNFELDEPKWTKESFAAEAAKANINVDYYGDPTENLFRTGADPNSNDWAFRVEGEWLTIGLVQTETGDTFLFHAPGRLNRRDLAAEVFLSHPEDYGNPADIWFQEINYYKMG